MSSADILEHYDRWLASTPLAARTRTNYRRWVAELVDDLVAVDELAAFLAPAGGNDRRAVLTDWRRRLVDRGLAPATVNLALAAATSLLDSRALARPTVPRVKVSAGDARALTGAPSCARSRRRPTAWRPHGTARSSRCCCGRACGSASSPRLTAATCS